MIHTKLLRRENKFQFCHCSSHRSSHNFANSFHHNHTGIDQPTNQTNRSTMYIIKRDGRQQRCQFDKIQSRISKLCYGLDQKVSSLMTLIGSDGACDTSFNFSHDGLPNLQPLSLLTHPSFSRIRIHYLDRAQLSIPRIHITYAINSLLTRQSSLKR